MAGLGKLGLPLAAVLAAAGHQVVGVDPYAPEVVDALRTASVGRFDEPGLADLILSLKPYALQAMTDYDRAMPGAEASLIVVPTPSLPDGRFDSSAVVEAVGQIAGRTPSDHLIIVVSTVQPGTMGGVVTEAAAGRPVAYCP